MHVVEADGIKWAEYINFRDALRANVNLANEYDQLELELVRQFPEERPKYTEGKSQFIQRVLDGFRKA